jgi:nicotinate-nucleotide--dimethylbenzimidazole phosphoribosyltransferase
MGIGNTTPASALIGLLTGHPARDVTGRARHDDPTLDRKTATVATAMWADRG